MLFTAVTFIAFTALVAVIAWWRTRDDDLSTQDGYFLAGRSLTGPVIAGSLMLTNLSTEQLIGQTGQSFSTNMGPIAWEVTSAAALVILALVFLPRYLKMGLTTVPEFLENRYDSTTKRIVSIMFLLGYLLTYLPTILYSGALVFNQIFEVDKRMGVSQMQGVIITCFALDYDTPDHYCERFNLGELEHRDTFSQRVLSEKPKFMQKKRTTKK